MWRRQQSFLPACKVFVLNKVSYPTEWLPHATRTIASVLVAERRTLPQKRSVCGGDEPQPVAHLSHKLQCARQSLKIMGINIPATKTRPPVAKQSGQCARALFHFSSRSWASPNQLVKPMPIQFHL